jgi:hypothetical protein
MFVEGERASKMRRAFRRWSKANFLALFSSKNFFFRVHLLPQKSDWI